MSDTDSMNEEQLSEYARFVVSHRHKVPGRCAGCGKEFTGYPGKTYCSSRCRQAAYYARRKNKKEDHQEHQEGA